MVGELEGVKPACIEAYILRGTLHGLEIVTAVPIKDMAMYSLHS